MSLTRLLPLLLLLPILTWAADSDKNFRVAPTMFKEGVLMEPVANMAIVKKEKMILSESPMVPLRPNIMFMRHKKVLRNTFGSRVPSTSRILKNSTLLVWLKTI